MIAFAPARIPAGRRASRATRGRAAAAALVVLASCSSCGSDGAVENTAAAPACWSPGEAGGLPPSAAAPPSPLREAAITGIMPEAHGHIGPVQDGNGHLYTVIEDYPGDDGGNEPMAMKSQDGGATWTEVDRAGRPHTGDLEGDWLVQVGTTVIFGYQKSNGSVFLASFGTGDAPSSADAWSSIEEQVHDAAVEPEEQWVGLSALGNGDLWVFYSTDPTADRTHRIAVRKRTAGTGVIGPEFLLDETRAVGQAVAVTGSDDRTHVFYTDRARRLVLYRTLAADGTLGPVVQVAVDAHRIVQPLTNPVVASVGGEERVTVAWADSAGVLHSTTVGVDGVPGPPQRLSDAAVVVDPGHTKNRGAVAHLASDGETVHAVYADAVSQDLCYDRMVGEGGWGTDVEIADGLETQWVTGLIARPDQDGVPVLGYLYDTGPHDDEAGNIHYAEQTLP